MKIVYDFMGIMVSNLLYMEGVRAKNVDKFSDDELRMLITDFEKSKMFHRSGMRWGTEEEYLKIAQRLLEQANGISAEAYCRASIVIAVISLEESVNEFIRKCNLGKKEYYEYEFIPDNTRKDIRAHSLDEKLDSFLHELSGHSMRVDLPKDWQTYSRAKFMRDITVHNPVEFSKFKEKAGEKFELEDIRNLASKFIESVKSISDYLSTIYPDEVLAIDQELHEIWQNVDRRLGIMAKVMDNIGRQTKEKSPEAG